jgi:hypothetical protein
VSLLLDYRYLLGNNHWFIIAGYLANYYLTSHIIIIIIIILHLYFIFYIFIFLFYIINMFSILGFYITYLDDNQVIWVDY